MYGQTGVFLECCRPKDLRKQFRKDQQRELERDLGVEQIRGTMHPSADDRLPAASQGADDRSRDGAK